VPDRVPYELPWHWENLKRATRERRMRLLATWVSWFVARYHLAGRVPACWYRHPGLADELKALWYQYQEVTRPLVPKIAEEFPGKTKVEEPKVAARQYREWHEARWRWTIGPLADATGYRECLARNQHVEDAAHAADAAAFAESSRDGLDCAIQVGEVAW
jgi:hypothetical protein